MRFLFSDIDNRPVGKILIHLVVAGLFLVGSYFFIKAHGASGPVEALIVFAAGVVFFSSGLLLLLYLHMGKLVSMGISSLIFPAKKLAEPALVLSPIQGKIVGGQLEEARDELLELLEKYPDNATISLMLVDLYSSRFGNFQQGLAIAEKYLKSGARAPTEDCIRLVMRCTDFCLQKNDIQRAILFLRNELSKSCYSKREKDSLRNRMDILSKNESDRV